jgi:ketosteroid isomerase-like protein
MTHETAGTWLDAYVRAWETYDPQAIGELFAEDAAYFEGPYEEPIRGRQAIVERWLVNPDPKGSFAAQYRPLAVESDLVVANGRSRYFQPDGVTMRVEYDNIFVLRFDADGRCAEYREWYMRQPEQAQG